MKFFVFLILKDGKPSYVLEIMSPSIGEAMVVLKHHQDEGEEIPQGLPVAWDDGQSSGWR